MRVLRLIAASLPLLLAAAPAAAQRDGDRSWVENCRRWNSRNDHETFCEEREVHLPRSGSLTIDGRENGGVSVKAWDGADILVRERIQTNARTEAEARRIASQIRVSTGGGTIAASGPEMERREGWSVSYEVMVPRRMDLRVVTANGPIGVQGVTGRMDLRAQNGPLSLREIGGDVHARAQNGPLTVTLAGSGWSGAGLDAETVNGPVTLIVPEGYNAHLTTGTVNGPTRYDFPMNVTVQGRMPRHITTDLGRGGAPVRVVTTNGPVTVRHD